MAQTVSSNQSDLYFSEVLGLGALQCARPRNIASQFVNLYSIAGRRATNLKLNRYTDPGPATTASEGTDFTTITTMGVETPVTLTPVEAAVLLAELTDDTSELVRGVVSARMIADDGSFESKMQLLMPTATRLAESAMEKMETDVVAEFGNATNSVGAGSGTEDMDLGLFEEAIFTLDEAEVVGPRDYIACLAPRQISDLRRALAVTSGGLQGSVHVGQSVDHLVNPQGFEFSLLGVNVFGYDKSAELTANTAADVVGAMFIPGVGNPEDPEGGSGRVGAIAACEGRPMQFSFFSDHKARSLEIMVNWKYDLAIRDADFICKIITDA